MQSKINLKNMEAGKKSHELVDKFKKEAEGEKHAAGHEKERGIEVSPLDRERVLSEIASVENEKEEKPGAGGIISIGDFQYKQKQREKQIEKILEKNLEDVYLNMPLAKQREFKVAGEQAARAINTLLNQAKTGLKKIIDLIKKWLLIIPGVNKFFLEQEAKIKADEIFKIKNKK
ncbi:MAG: hypothetical protein Q8N21_03770 [bacterium]|nr:hypothetical protein [bacterium]